MFDLENEWIFLSFLAFIAFAVMSILSVMPSRLFILTCRYGIVVYIFAEFGIYTFIPYLGW